MLTQGVLGGSQLWLSSGVEPAKETSPAPAGESPLIGRAESSQFSQNAIYGDDGAAYPTSSVLEIFPPFRLQLALKSRGAAKQTIVEANSDSEFRAVRQGNHTYEGLDKITPTSQVLCSKA